MPTYEYECKSCGHTFEVFQSMKDDPLKDCPECGKEIRRLIFGGTGVIFKGSGFYVTDKGKGSSQSTSTAAKSSKPAEAPAGGVAVAAEAAPKKADAPSGGGSSDKTEKAVASKSA